MKINVAAASRVRQRLKGYGELTAQRMASLLRAATYTMAAKEAAAKARGGVDRLRGELETMRTWPWWRRLAG